jgi:hypothetical protein
VPGESRPKTCDGMEYSRNNPECSTTAANATGASGRHEILNEADKGLVHRDVGHWLYQFLDEPTTEI